MKSLINKTWSFLKDFFNPKEWLKLLRSVPAMALTLIVLSGVLMNILAAKSIINLPANFSSKNWFTNGDNMWIVQDAGIIVSWLGFLAGDLLVKAFGSKNAVRINLTSLFLSLFISLLLIGVSKVPGTWSPVFNEVLNPGISNEAEIINGALNEVIGNVWFVILGSAAATFVGILVNNITHGILLKKLYQKRGEHYVGYFIAAGASTVIGQFIDNIVFALIVGVNFFGWSYFSVVMCSLLGALVEFVVEMLFTPLTYKLSKNWSKNGIGDDWMNLEKAEQTKQSVGA